MKPKKIQSSPPIKLDSIDRKILNILQNDNQISNLDLSKRVGLSAPPCLRRVRELRESGVITQDVSLLDPSKVGQNLVVFVSITLEKQREDLLSHFERRMMEEPEVLQCYFVSGEVDYHLVIHVADMVQYNEFARRVFANEPNIKAFRSSFCLNRVKYNTQIQLNLDQND